MSTGHSPDAGDDNDAAHAHAQPPVPSFYRPSETRERPSPLSVFRLDGADPCRESPSPPASFLDRLLNPAGLAHHRHSPLSSNPPLPRHRDPAATPTPTPTATATPAAMPANTRSHDARPARLPNGYVDLTATPDSPPHRRKRRSPTPGPSKRHKRDHGDPGDSGTAADRATNAPDAAEERELSEDKLSAQEMRQKQREDALRLQAKPEEKPTTFNTITCVICMDTPTHLTATACGHLFCHTCLMEALIAGENRSGPGEPKRSQCPVCRKFINRSKTADIIPLMLKKGLATQPRKKVASAAGAAAAAKG